MLTPKQEKYVQNLIKGMSQREAYKNSYDAKNMKDETIDSKACELLKKDKIKERYEELQEKADNEAIMSAIERKKWLTDVITGEIKEKIFLDGVQAERDAYLSDKMKAMEILNKMSGEYVTKIEGDIGVTTIEVDLDDE